MRVVVTTLAATTTMKFESSHPRISERRDAANIDSDK